MNIGKLLTKSARGFPQNLGLAHGTRKWTYAQFNTRANQLANALQRLGVRPGDHVAVLMYNCPEMLETMFAGFKAGCGVVPINFRLHPKECAYIIDHSQAKTVIFSPEFNQAIADIRNDIPQAAHLIALAGAEGEFLDYETLLSAESEEFDDAEVACDDVAWLFYTSGTTGQPKGAMLTHRNLLAMSMSFYADMCPDFGTSEVMLHAAPLSHGSGLYALPNVGKAAAHIFPESKSFDPEQVLELIQQYRVTNMFAAPTMIKLLLDSPALEQYDFSSMKALTYGGAPMLTEDMLVAIEKLGPCLVQLYGQGESPMTISYLCHQDHVTQGTSEQMQRLGSAGMARTDVEIKIVDQDDKEYPSGQIGEIATRSDLVMKGYWRDPDASATALKNGWLHTGDVGYIDESGYLFLMDRSKDMIISGGENIYPREIEEVLIQHPAVHEVAVVGVPDVQWGEVVKAIVVLVPGKEADEAELIYFCKDRIASYKKPKSIDFIDVLPKNNYGKILKRELRAKYWQGKQRNLV
jgi:acyl-CoA synthetase (AMP-forming)/AMP-acid ligase II